MGCELDVLVNLKECEKYSLLVNEEIGIDKTVVCLRSDLPERLKSRARRQFGALSHSRQKHCFCCAL